MEVIIILSILIIVAITSVLWGKDSRDTIDSKEWERRQNTFYQSPLF